MKIIVAVDENWGIGRNNDLLFSIPEDMAFFRRTTQGATVVMGRSTLESLPGGRPLKNRQNIVLTRNTALQLEGARVCHTLEELGRVLATQNPPVYVIGGAQMYALLLDYCEEALVTKVFADGKPETFFPNLDRAEHWELAEQGEQKSHEGLHFRFCVYRNSKPLPLPGGPFGA